MLPDKFDIRKLDIHDIIVLLERHGYAIGNDFEWTIDNNAFKYNGFNASYGIHKFLLAYYDEDEGEFQVTKVAIALSAAGYLCADYSGEILFTSTDEDDVLAYIERVCN